MYVVLRIIQIAALVVFLWGNTNNNAEHLAGAGGPYLVWGSFAVMILTAYQGAKVRQKSGVVTKEQIKAENKRSWIIAAVILLAAAVLTAIQFLGKP